MSEKRYIRNCKQCGKEYVAKSTKSEFDTVACRSRYYREQQNVLLSTQTRVVKTQAKIINAILPKPEIELPAYHLSYSRNYDQVQKILHELNTMRKEAEKAAIEAGRGKEQWSPYVKDSVHFKQLCRMIQNISK